MQPLRPEWEMRYLLLQATRGEDENKTKQKKHTQRIKFSKSFGSFRQFKVAVAFLYQFWCRFQGQIPFVTFHRAVNELKATEIT